MSRRLIPNLPVEYKDEAGILLRHIQSTVVVVDELIEEKQDLASLLSHDLRTPLTQIRGLADLAHAGLPEAQQKEVALEIVRLADKQLGLLQGVLQLLRHDNLGAGSTPKEVVNLSSLLVNLQVELQPLLNAKKLKLDIHVPSDIEL